MKRRRNQIGRSPILAERVRSTDGGFSFVPHRFLRGGFWASFETHHELLLYFLLVLAADRNGISFYSCDSLCTLLSQSLDEYIAAREGLITKDLIAFDGRRFQVLSLPAQPAQTTAPPPLLSDEDFEESDPATIRTLLRESFDNFTAKLDGQARRKTRGVS